MSDCICKGNWREIIRESEPLFGEFFNDKDGEIYEFVGIMHGADDYYYAMWKAPDYILLSCVGSLEQYGFTPLFA